MNSALLNSLIAFYEEDPSDPFNIYALALEYQKTDSERAKQLFKELLEKHPDYLATYYSAAQFFSVLEENDLALEVYQSGIELAGKQGNTKTLSELQRALRALQDDLEE